MVLSIFLVVALCATLGCLDSPPYVLWGDLNEDGISDLVVIEDATEEGGDRISVLLGNDTNPAFMRPVVEGFSIEDGSVFIADINADKHLDILFVEVETNNMIAYGNGDGTFLKATKLKAKDLIKSR